MEDERRINIRVDGQTFTEIKTKLARTGQTIQDVGVRLLSEWLNESTTDKPVQLYDSLHFFPVPIPENLDQNSLKQLKECLDRMAKLFSTDDKKRRDMALLSIKNLLELAIEGTEHGKKGGTAEGPHHPPGAATSGRLRKVVS